MINLDAQKTINQFCRTEKNYFALACFSIKFTKNYHRILSYRTIRQNEISEIEWLIKKL